MKILIAGLGSIGRRHFRNLLSLGERDLVLFRTKRSTLPDEELVGFPNETDLKAALNHQPQAAVISNPTSLHLDVAIPCAQSGCHLLIEKPVSNSMERLPELQEEVTRTGAGTLVGYHFRHHPNLVRLKGMIEAGEIGSPLSVRAHWGEYLPDWHPWEDFRAGYSARKDLGGGVILTLSHQLDYMRWIFGDVEALWAFYSKTGALDINVEDIAEIGLRFRSGLIGSLHLDYHQRPGAHTLEILGSRGSLRWEAATGNLLLFQPQNPGWQEYPAPDGYQRNDLFLAEMRHFLQVCHNYAPSVCPLQDGIEALRLALAAYTSQENGKLIYL